MKIEFCTSWASLDKIVRVTARDVASDPFREGVCRCATGHQMSEDEAVASEGGEDSKEYYYSSRNAK